MPTDRKVALAVELERALLAADPRIVGVESCDYGDSLGETAVVTTTGIRRSSRATGCELVAYSLAGDDDETQTGFGFSLGRDFDELDVDAAAGDAADRALRMLGATKPPSGAAHGRARSLGDGPAHRHRRPERSAPRRSSRARSLFAGREGEQVAAPFVTLVEDPTDARSWGASPVDAEGLATRRGAAHRGGRAAADSSTPRGPARRMGVRSTGSAVRAGFKSTPTAGCRAVTLTPGDRDAAALLADVGDGVLVQEVSGLHSGVNPISGDFSTGAQGLRISGGALAEPLREFTIASTIQRLLHDLVAVGADLTWLPMSAAGMTLVVGDVAVSGA